MLIKLMALGAFAVAGFLFYVNSRDGKFSYERNGYIAAPPEKIYPYISDLKLGGTWSPYEKIDPNMKKNFLNGTNEVGSTLEFDGNSQAGSGSIKILSLVPNQAVELRLLMVKPFSADNIVTYRLTPEAEGTRFSWSMSGDGGFMGKLMNVFIDCEKMVGDQFSQGIENLKNLVESKI